MRSMLAGFKVTPPRAVWLPAALAAAAARPAPCPGTLYDHQESPSIRHSNDSIVRIRLTLEALEPLVLRGGSLCHRGRQAISPDRP